MEKDKPLVTLTSILLVGIGVSSLALNFIFDWSINLSLPLVIIVLGAAFFILGSVYFQKWAWAVLLYVPGSLLAVLGAIFLLNEITGDWNSWAYAWLLAVAGLGMGMLLAGRSIHWPVLVSHIGAGLILGGITLFILFGAIAGGRFILVMAPVLLILGGLALRWLRLETYIPEHILQRFYVVSGLQSRLIKPPPDQSLLIEPLSPREIEVLELIEQGLSNPEIAERLVVAPSTVKTHINNIYGKLGVQTRIRALKRAKELGLFVS